MKISTALLAVFAGFALSACGHSKSMMEPTSMVKPASVTSKEMTPPPIPAAYVVKEAMTEDKMMVAEPAAPVGEYIDVGAYETYSGVTTQ